MVWNDVFLYVNKFNKISFTGFGQEPEHFLLSSCSVSGATKKTGGFDFDMISITYSEELLPR